MSNPTDSPHAATPPDRRITWDSGGKLTVAAPAKINLNLLVGPLAGDGYHPLDSIVARISLHDVLQLQARTDGQVTLNCGGMECGCVAEDNLVMRAAKLLQADRQTPGADIALAKMIPAGAGLGGGSSDAAAALLGLSELWQLAIGEAELHAMACQLGSDVPLFLSAPASRMTGRGELLASVDVHPFFLVLVLPGFGCPTAAVYRAYDDSPSPIGPQMDLQRLADQPPSAWRDELINDLAAAAMAACPELAELWQRLADSSPVAFRVTGSGSGLFALCDSADEAAALAAALPSDLQAMCICAASNPW